MDPSGVDKLTFNTVWKLRDHRGGGNGNPITSPKYFSLNKIVERRLDFPFQPEFENEEDGGDGSFTDVSKSWKNLQKIDDLMSYMKQKRQEAIDLECEKVLQPVLLWLEEAYPKRKQRAAIEALKNLEDLIKKKKKAIKFCQKTIDWWNNNDIEEEDEDDVELREQTLQKCAADKKKLEDEILKDTDDNGEELSEEKHTGLQVQFDARAKEFKRLHGFDWDGEDTVQRTESFRKKVETASAHKKRVDELERQLREARQKKDNADEQVQNSSQPPSRVNSPTTNMMMTPDGSSNSSGKKKNFNLDKVSEGEDGSDSNPDDDGGDFPTFDDDEQEDTQLFDNDSPTAQTANQIVSTTTTTTSRTKRLTAAQKRKAAADAKKKGKNKKTRKK